MAASILSVAAALLVTIFCPTEAHSPAPTPAAWPTCSALYNWYWCRGHREGGLYCEFSYKRGSTEPAALLWTRDTQADDLRHIPGQDDFGFIYNVINYEGHLKLSIRYCFKGEGTYSGIHDWHHTDPPPCKKNWYNCDVTSDRTTCQLRLCPWSHEPLLPVSGKASDFYGCTKVGGHIDCYLNNIGDRTIKHHSWPHEKLPDVHQEKQPHDEY